MELLAHAVIAGRAPDVFPEEARFFLVRDEPCPVGVTAAFELSVVVRVRDEVVTPGIPGKQLVAARPGERNLDELGREPRDVVVLICHAHAKVLEVPYELGKHPGHVACVHDHLVMLGAESARNRFRIATLVEHELEPLDRR